MNARKRDHSWASAVILPYGEVNILPIIFKLLTMSVPCKIIYTKRMFVLVSMIILGLSKWSFQ